VEAVRRLRAKPTPRSRVHQLRLAATADVGYRVTARMTVNARRGRLDHPSWRDRGVHHFGCQMMVHG
jgi:hypothetical protein